MSRVLALLLVALLAAPPAMAHAFLERATPPVGSELPSAPATVALRFTEAVEPRFSSIELRQPGVGVVATGALAVAKDGRTLSVSLPRLPPGTYTVSWHVTSVDSHKTEGRFAFTIVP